MGAYLSEPNTQKESQDDSTDQISYGASSMQGWRLEQEDAHTSLLNFDARTRSSLFAVYDGHGGSEVAKYCAKYLPEYLQAHLDEFRDGGDLKAALKHLFLALDERLKSEEAQRELKEMRDKSEKGDDADTTAIQNDEDLSQVDKLTIPKSRQSKRIKRRDFLIYKQKWVNKIINLLILIRSVTFF